MERHHRRWQVCHTRPAYRDGRKEKAVKVYTINDESHYVLVQGVPALKLTKELLDVCSLYGAIQEYRVLDDFPEKEEFTEVYWIQYQQIQAARVAKRKLDNRPFYGGTLHVCYAPEYETIDDTRQKLQGRRKAVAKRLRMLQTEQQESSEPDSSKKEPDDTEDRKEGESQETEPSDRIGFTVSTALSVNQSITVTEHETSSGITSGKHLNTDIRHAGTEFPPLALPPKTLPVSQWTGPDRPSSEFPRIPTAHATLPMGFNPYPETKPTGEGNPSITTQKEIELFKNAIGPCLQSECFRKTTQGLEPITSKNYNGKGAKPTISAKTLQRNTNMKQISRKRPSSDNHETGNQPLAPSESKPERPVKRRALDRCSLPRTHPHSSIPPEDVSPSGTFGGAVILPKMTRMPTQAGHLQEAVGLGLSTASVRSHDLAPNTGNASLDNTVRDIRNRMRAVTGSCTATDSDTVAQPAQRPLQHAQPKKSRRKI